MECRREFPRVNLEFAVKYEVIKWDESCHHPKKPMEATCHDISIRGIRFEHNLELTDRIIKHLKEGTSKLNLEFSLPDDDTPINILGRAVYCGEEENELEDEKSNQCMGVAFIDIEPDDYLKINEFINSSVPVQP